VQGHLVTITSAAENAYVTGLIGLDSWIAADDTAVEGVFRHSAGPEVGSALAYTAWGTGQPDNYLNNDDCILLWKTSSPNNWRDAPCANILNFVVEYECSAIGMEMSITGCRGLSCF
jgi:hypothetical protein